MRILITGSNRGIGLEYVRQFLARGDRVFAACRKPETATELQALKTRYGNQLSLVTLEVSDPESVQGSVATVQAETDALDLLINNAAINPGDEDLDTLKVEDMMRTFEVNVVGVMLVSRAYTDLLKAGENPRLVQISSGAGSIALKASANQYSYPISKASLNMLNKIMQVALKPMGITSIVMDPGWVKTDMGGPNAKLEPEDSIRQQIAVIDGLTLADTGSYLRYDGGELPW